MSQENLNNPPQNTEEVDLIRLLNYFKNGIKSFFRAVGKLFDFIIQFIYLLKKNWLLIVSLVLLAVIYGKWIKPLVFGQSTNKVYEMVVKSDPVFNYELYAVANEINNQFSDNSNPKAEGVQLAKKLNLSKIQMEAIPKMEDVVNKYFTQTENNTVRAFETDTLFYKDFELKAFKSNLEDTDYSFQKVRIWASGNKNPSEIQTDFLTYINQLSGIKTEKEAKLTRLTILENQLKTTISRIDSILIARVASNMKEGGSGVDQTVVNTAARGNVEYDLLRFNEVYIKKLYGTLQAKSDIENGVIVVSNLRSVGNSTIFENAIIKYSLYGFILACVIILLIQLNKYLEKYAKRKSL